MEVSVSQPHILVINDSPELQILFKDLLSGEGYTVSCLYAVSTDPDTIVGQNADVVIMDYLWCVQDRNWPLLQALRTDRRTRGIPVILCPGVARPASEISRQLTEMGILSVRKPFDIDEMLQLVSDALPYYHGASSSANHNHSDLPEAGSSTALLAH